MRLLTVSFRLFQFQMVGLIILVFLTMLSGLYTILTVQEADMKAEAAKELALLNSAPITIIDATLVSYDGVSAVIRITAERHRNCRFDVWAQWQDRSDIIVSHSGQKRVVLASGETGIFNITLDRPSEITDPPFDVRSVAEYRCENGIFVVPTPWVTVEKVPQ